MSGTDWMAIGVGAFLIVVMAGIALLRSRFDRRNRVETRHLFSDAQAALWSILIGGTLVGLGAFVAESTDVTTFFVGLGASLLGAGMVSTLSLEIPSADD